MRLRHPKSGRRITVAADRADLYKSQGWVEYRQPAKRAAKKAAAKRTKKGT